MAAREEARLRRMQRDNEEQAERIVARQRRIREYDERARRRQEELDRQAEAER